ncbi:hypothetical protein FAM09_00285 [Niastella caeni]|uniref:PKD/Chitinase domain-containing protein n=1 Tax=Niastella caeni TaxID=2569763 RepID=A0A4S8HXT7_9BACT|nr:carboxypeptidase-like regulatory domain-containing protein [Niastella caeni]THU40588.1 hypothetical protein FAM09_00285 [Niastella caeni]
MYPVNTVFPEFVPDQLLTSSDLNELFGYLDEQGRMTRTNLIGIGIVCGLEVKVNAAQTEVTITKGCGVTSEGYLITMPFPHLVFTEYNTYDPVKEKYYDRFIDIATKEPKFDTIWELKQAGVDPDAIDITPAFLEDKVVLLFVELLAEKNKNCDPNSCDDKGIHVTVNFKPLLVTKDDAATLIGPAAGSVNMDTFTGLPEIKMRRFDVPNTNPVTSADIFNAYKAVLNNTFLGSTEDALKQAYDRFSGFVLDEYPSNPFAGLAASFAFLNNGTITTNQLQHIQYYYDLFSDFLLAYEEFRKTGTHILSACCPDSGLFPRHLLLGEAIPLPAGTPSTYRHYFIYSPLFDQRNILAQLRMLFKKLVLLRQKFSIPPVSSGPPTAGIDPYIRITPSTLGDVGLSQKAIPYYYDVHNEPTPLYKHWNYQKTRQGIPFRNLSYHADKYNNFEDFIKTPLLYDLEPYNFLRIEGIIGKSYTRVLQNLKSQIKQNRLPVDVIALSTDNSNILKGITAKNVSSFNLTGTIADMDLMNMLCHFQDLEAMYDAMKNEMLCTLCKELKYYYDGLNVPEDSRTRAAVAGTPSKVPLFKHCSPGYMVKPGSFGAIIEELYNRVGDEGNVTLDLILEILGLNNNNNADVSNNEFLASLVLLFEVPIYIIRLSNQLPSALDTFDAEEYCHLHSLLAKKATDLRILTNRPALINPPAGSTTAVTVASVASSIMQALRIEDLSDHLDALIFNCKCSAFKALRTEYLKRVVYLTLLRQFGHFTKSHPGIQHKAGVPMGGTFIIVYHSERTRISSGRAFGRFNLTGQVLDETGIPLPNAQVMVKESTRRTSTDATGNFGQVVIELPTTLIVQFPGYDNKEIFVDSEDDLRIVLGAEGTVDVGDPIDDIVNGTVIADFYLPYRCCSDCPPIQYLVPELKEPPKPTEGPVANAGTDQVITLPVNSVTLTGSGTAAEGNTISSYQWAKLSGPGTQSIATPGSSQTSVSGLLAGTYEFELTVTDNNGNSARDTMIVIVNPAPPPPNTAPTANAGADRNYVLSTNLLELDGSGSSDPEGPIQSYLWQWVSGPNVPTLLNPGLEKTKVQGLMAGTYVFRLTVTDNGGLTGTDTVSITVELPPNVPPVANAGLDQVIALPVNSVTLNGSASFDPDGTITNWSWSQVSGPNTPIGSANAAVATAGPLVAGTYVFELKVTDNRGDSATDRVTITVEKEAEKSCSPLNAIIELFNKLPENDPDRFPAFRDVFQFYKQVESYFRQMEQAGVMNMPVDQQINFFATPVGGQTINNLLVTWLNALQQLIGGKEFRLLALCLYRILAQLAMYIMCIQKDDLDKARIPMEEVFKVIREHVAEWAVQRDQFTAQEMAVIKEMGQDFRNEDVRINTNGEASIKPKYLSVIRAIIKIFDSI